MLNYSYMLGELELFLTSGDDLEQRKGVKLLSQFSDQRSLNILLDYLKDRVDQSSDITISILNILMTRDISANMTANQVLKMVIESSKEPEIKRLAILCLGRCRNDADIDYLIGWKRH